MKEKQEFPYCVEDDLGDVVMSEQHCPGVYYIAVERAETRFAAEFYIVEKSAEAISDKVKAYGKPLAHHSELLSIAIDEYGSGSTPVKYEVARYRIQNGMPPIDEDTLLAIAVYGAEDYPDYFGGYTTPQITPRGIMTRYKMLANGVFFVETDRCEKMLAVCYPVWHSNFSHYVIRQAEQTEYDKIHGIDNTLGYLFFSYDAMCLAIFELLKEKPEIVTSGAVDAAALHNAVWTNYPEYAVEYNKAEQTGMHDVLGMLLNLVGVEIEPSGSVDEMMKITLGAGTDYLKVLL